jgi:SAM-dependent methyltransferase
MFRRRSTPWHRPRVRLDAGSMAERWDKEWIAYFRRAPEYFDDFSAPNGDSRRRVQRVRAALGQAFDSADGPVDPVNPVWAMWAIACYPREIVDRRVADLGCGAGGIGRTLGYVAREYVGIDYSPLALRVAQLVSPAGCTYIARSDMAAIAQHRNTIETAFSRSVFIHQNFQQAVELATVAANLLVDGGVLAADFHRPEIDDSGAFVRPPRLAKGQLDADRPTVGFYFTDVEIAEVGAASGLTLEAIIDAPERNWRIARYRR